MYEVLGKAELKTGETVEIGVLTPPVGECKENLRRLLGHKEQEWVWQIDKCLDGETDEMVARFYVAKRGDDLISNVSTFESGSVGILGHVWTPVDERRKGLCTRIFDKLMDHHRARGGGLLLLGTGFDTPPYDIYQRYGFAGYYDGSGLMRYCADDDFEAKYFAPARTLVVDMTWGAYPKANALAAEEEEYVKSMAYRKFYKDSVEDAFVYVMQELEKGEGSCAKVLESESTGAVVAYAWTIPDRRFRGVFIMDLCCHPNHMKDTGKLLAEMTWPDAKVMTYVEAGLDEKTKGLEGVGFVLEGIMKKALKKRDGFADMMIYSRNV